MPYVVVSYDIASDDRRLRLSKLLLNYGNRVQYSVFECRIEEKLLLELKEKADAIIDMREDSLRFYVLCKRCIPNISISGRGVTAEDEDLYIV